MPRVKLLREAPLKYGQTKKATVVMKVREDVYDYLTSEAGRTKRTAQGEMELWGEMFRAIQEEFHNDDPEFIRAEIARLRKKAGEGK